MSSCYLTLLFLGSPTVNEHFVLMKRIMTKLNQSKIKKAETFRKKMLQKHYLFFMHQKCIPGH